MDRNKHQDFTEHARSYFSNKKWNFGRFCDHCYKLPNFPTHTTTRQQLASDLWHTLLTEYAQGSNLDSKAKASVLLAKIRQRAVTTNNIVNADTINGFVNCKIENSGNIIPPATNNDGQSSSVPASRKRKTRAETPVPSPAPDCNLDLHNPPPPYEDKNCSSAVPPREKKARQYERSETPGYDGGKSSSASPLPARDSEAPALKTLRSSLQKAISDTPKSAAPQDQEQSLRQRLFIIQDSLRAIEQLDDDIMTVFLDAFNHLKRSHERRAKFHATIMEQLPFLIDNPIIRDNDHLMTSRDETENENENENEL